MDRPYNRPPDEQGTSLMTSMNDLAARGQSVWLDYIRRDLIESGELDELVGDGLRGMTSNPTIFQKAMASGEYDDDIAEILASQADVSTKRLYELLAVPDIAELNRDFIDWRQRLKPYLSESLRYASASRDQNEHGDGAHAILCRSCGAFQAKAPLVG